MPWQPGDYTIPVTQYPKSSEKGWECPKCGNIYAPFMIECGKCNKANHENRGGE